MREMRFRLFVYSMIGALAIALAQGGAEAKKSSEKVLHAFAGSDGANPMAGLIADKAGNFYGTTETGGLNHQGTVFELTPDGSLNVLYNFCTLSGCSDGEQPTAGLIMDELGALYGTTSIGGNGGGIVFKLMPGVGESVLHTFAGDNYGDGAIPAAGLIVDKKGNLYGTTEYGGKDAHGAVFKISSNGAYSVLYIFCSQKNCSDGANPEGGLVMDKAGNLFGTTISGGDHNAGTVFELAPGGEETVLHSFCSKSGCGDGDQPEAALLLDNVGNLYGTTEYGGSGGNGLIFKLAQDGTQTLLHIFNGTDGAFPVGALLSDKKGNLYTTTRSGGHENAGTIIKLSPDGATTVLYSFTGGSDGRSPFGGLAPNEKFKLLYGTTESGGESNHGVVFSVKP